MVALCPASLGTVPVPIGTALDRLTRGANPGVLAEHPNPRAASTMIAAPMAINGRDFELAVITLFPAKWIIRDQMRPTNPSRDQTPTDTALGSMAS